MPPLFDLAIEIAGKLVQHALTVTSLLEPFLTPRVDPRAKPLGDLYLEICALTGQINNHRQVDIEAVRLMQELHLAQFRFVELALRFAVEPEPDQMLDTLADEVMKVRENLVPRTDLIVTSATEINEALLWVIPWQRSAGNSRIGEWLTRLSPEILARTARNRPHVKFAAKALAELRFFYMED